MAMSRVMLKEKFGAVVPAHKFQKVLSILVSEGVLKQEANGFYSKVGGWRMEEIVDSVKCWVDTI